MHIAGETRRLRDEHTALATLSQYLLDLVAAAEPPRPTEIEAVRGLFRDTLVRHLKCEDWALYPRLRDSGDPALADLAQLFVAEIGTLADEYARYDGLWPTGRIAAEWPRFRRETRAILAALRRRMAREERELYPVAE